MSKTDKTRPFWVKVKDHKVLRPRLEHDEMWYDFTTYKWWIGEMQCGCPMCSNDAYLDHPNRKTRRDGKRYTREWDKEY